MEVHILYIICLYKCLHTCLSFEGLILNNNYNKIKLSDDFDIKKFL